MKVELINRREDLNLIAKKWDELANADPRDGFFRTSGWYLSWLDFARPDAKPFVVVVRDNDGEIVGLAPLCQVSYRDHWLPLNAISIGGREVVSGDFLDYLAAPHARAQVLHSILDFLWQRRSAWELMVVGEVPEGSDLQKEVESCAERNHIPVRRQESRVCPYIQLPQTFEEYMSTFSKKKRHELRRQMRVLLEKQGAQIDVWADPKTVVEKLNILAELHSGRWNRANQSGNMHRPGFVQFLTKVCESPPAGSSARLYLLSHQEKSVAALLIFYYGQSAFLYSMGWDSASPIANLSPGLMLILRSIEDAILEGFHFYDFLRGDEKYKSQFTKLSRPTVTLLVGRSFSANAYLRVLGYKDSLKQHFPVWWDRFFTSRDQRLTDRPSGETVEAASDAVV